MSKILMVSLGSIGKRHLRNTRTLLPDSEIAVYRQHTRPGNNNKAPEGANHILFSLEEALNFEPNAVIISSPASEHIKNAIPFMRKNCHIFLEKPLADEYSKLEPLIKAANTSSGFTMVGYVLRFLPTLHFMKKMMHEGRLGKVHYARVEVGQYLPDWRPSSDYRSGVSAQKALGGGALLELSHEIDYATWLFGQPQSLFCSADTVSDLEIDVEDSAHIIFEYSESALARKVILQLDFLQRVANMEVQVVGEMGTLRADLINERVLLQSPQNPKGVDLNCPKCEDGNEIYLRQFDFFFHKSIPGYKARFAESQDFHDWADVESGSKVLGLVDIAKRSNSEGTLIEI